MKNNVGLFIYLLFLQHILLNSMKKPIDTEQLNYCIERCKNKINKKNELTVIDNESENNEECKEEQDDSQNIKSILINNKNVEPVNKFKIDDIVNLLKNKCKVYHQINDQKKTSLDNDCLDNYINSFCHPDIISKVKENILNKT